MHFLKKLIYFLLAATLIFGGLWLVVANDQQLSLNLLFLSTPLANAGLVVLLSFAAGCLVGLVVGFNLLELVRLRSRLFLLKREVRQLQDALGDKH